MCAGNTEEEAKGYRTKNIKELSAHRHCRLTAMIRSQLIVWQCAVRSAQCAKFRLKTVKTCLTVQAVWRL